MPTKVMYAYLKATKCIIERRKKIEFMRWNEVDCKFQEAKRFMRQEVHQDGVEKPDFLKQRSATTSVR